MSKKTLQLITGITTGISTIASAVVTFIQPSYAAAIVAGIGIVASAVIEVCTNFVTKAE